MKGVTVESNAKHGLLVTAGAIAQVQGCTMRDNTLGNYTTNTGGRIEHLDLVAADDGSGTVVATESELLAALGSGAPRVVVKAGARIELTSSQAIPDIKRKVRIEGEAGAASLPAIIGMKEASRMLCIRGTGVKVELQGLRIEGRANWMHKTILCQFGASVVMESCEVTGNQVYVDGEQGMGTRIEMRSCTLADSKSYALFMCSAASALLEDCTIRGCTEPAVLVNDDGTCIEVSTAI